MKATDNELPELCAKCQDVFTGYKEGWTEYPHTKEWEALETNASGGCRLCIIMYDNLKDRVHARAINLRAAVVHSLNRIIIKWDERDDEGSASSQLFFVIGLDQGSIGAEGHDVQESTASPANQRLAGNWLQRCMQEHTACNKNSKTWYPKRLLDLQLLGRTGKIRLVETDAECLTGPYIALSYCWGRGQPFTLRRDTYQTLAGGFPSSLLPRTLSEAASVASWFKVRYLWVDALCIMQDSNKDWKEESKNMRQVYQHSLLVIAATAASNTGEGCFRIRNPALVPALKIDHRWLGSHHVLRPPILVFKSSLWKTDVDSAPLAHRAWTVQERFLARRVLHFGAEQLLWECHHGVSCETFPLAAFGERQSSFPRRGICGSLSLDGSEYNNAEDPGYIRRSRLVEIYMAGALTKSSDKLLAFAGIAEEMMSVYLHDQYLAGLWKNKFGRWLLWCIRGCAQADGRPSVRSRVYRAPSWSWLSVDGAVVTGIITISGPILSEVLDVRVNLVDPEYPAGEIKGGVVTLRGALILVSWNINDHMPPANRYRTMIDAVDRGMIYFDEPPNPHDRGRQLSFVPLDPPIFNSEAGEVRGLLLELVSIKSLTFKRVGIACVSTTRREYPFFFKRKRADKDLEGWRLYRGSDLYRDAPIEKDEDWEVLPRQQIKII